MTGLEELRTKLDGNLLTPTSPGYDAARMPALPRFRNVRPQGVVQCATTRDVARTLTFAEATGAHVVPRGGGHCFAGRSSTTGLLLDLGQLDAVTVDPHGRATIGAGARLAKVYEVLHQRGRTIPAGCGPTVGITGLTLGGGLGLLGRRHGLTCDALVGAHIVLADGRSVDCDADQEPELLWALRGAGGGQFGVVTSLVFATVPEPRATRFELRWSSIDETPTIVSAWQAWAPDAPDDVTANLTIITQPDGSLRTSIFGAALRAADATSALLADLVSSAGSNPDSHLQGGIPFRDLKRSFVDLDDRDARRSTTSRSEFFARPLPAATIAALVDELLTGPYEHRALNFTAMGGAYNRVAPEATAFVHRSERFLLEHVGEDGASWVDRSWSIAHTFGSGRIYPNFPDPRLDPWTDAYHGTNLARLIAAKELYDPGQLFRFPEDPSMLADRNEGRPA